MSVRVRVGKDTAFDMPLIRKMKQNRRFSPIAHRTQHRLMTSNPCTTAPFASQHQCFKPLVCGMVRSAEEFLASQKKFAAQSLGAETLGGAATNDTAVAREAASTWCGGLVVSCLVSRVLRLQALVRCEGGVGCCGMTPQGTTSCSEPHPCHDCRVTVPQCRLQASGIDRSHRNVHEYTLAEHSPQRFVRGRSSRHSSFSFQLLSIPQNCEHFSTRVSHRRWTRRSLLHVRQNGQCLGLQPKDLRCRQRRFIPDSVGPIKTST